MMNKLQILLLCHNRIAIPALRYLHEEGVLAGIAVPDLYDFVHRPFIDLAAQLNVPVTSLSKGNYRYDLHGLMRTLKPDAVFVIAFPWILPVSMLPETKYGFLNFHGGLLPQMRGSDPMFECIRRGIHHTGVTVHRMDDGVDTGPIVLQQTLETGTETTNGMLGAQIAHVCEQLSRQLLEQIRTGAPLEVTAQDEEQANYWPKPTQDDTVINWNIMTSAEIKALVNACNPHLKGATTIFNGWPFGITHVTDINLTGDGGQILPGTILYADPQQGMIIYCKDGKALRLDIIFTEEGFFPGYKLAMFGLAPGMQLVSQSAAPAMAPA